VAVKYLTKGNRLVVDYLPMSYKDKAPGKAKAPAKTPAKKK